MSNYFNRFYPLQAAKLFVKSLKNNNNTSALNSPTKVLKLTKDLTQNQSNAALVDAVKSIFIKFDTLPDQKQLDFTVSRRVSTILDAGYGVFLNGNTQKAGSILCFYPGTIYMSSDPIFFVSLSNQYILKCADGIYIDGKSNGLSGRVYSSLYKRENWPGAILVSDNTWMTATNDIKNLRNPLAIGQFVNNHTDECKANVYYQEIDVCMPEFPNHLKKYLPNMYFNPAVGTDKLRIVALIAIDDIHDGQELFSTYMDLV